MAVLFNVVNRMAHALDLRYASEAERLTAAQMLMRFDYRIPDLLLD